MSETDLKLEIHSANRSVRFLWTPTSSHNYTPSLYFL